MAVPISLRPTPEEAATDEPSAYPFSCITGVSKDILRLIQQGALSAKARYFLTMIAIDSFGNAGWQKQQQMPQPGVWCRFHLSAWAEEHGWTRQYAWRVREQMVALGILFYEPDSTHPELGILRWNLDFSQWRVLDEAYRRQRSARSGAGRPRKPEEPGQREAPLLEAVTTPNEPLAVFPSQPSQDEEHLPEKSSVLHETKKSNGLQKKSNVLQTPSGEEIKRVTPACSGAAQAAEPVAVLRKELRKKRRKTEPSHDGSDAPRASPEDLLVHHSPDENGSSPASLESSLASSGETAPASCWPPRETWEKTDLDYYQRVLREREKERVALLVRLAHERLGVLLEKTSYARVGALAKQCGAALLAKHILLAAANHIDGDPLDYLTRLARGKPGKEAANATRTPTSSSQPYTAEEASALVWNTL